MLRSLGLRSDLLSMQGVSTLTPCGQGHILRTPSEPTYWSGNALIRNTFEVQPDADIAAFCAAFPDSTHVKILWDTPSPDVDPMRAAFPAPFTVDTFDVLTLYGVAMARSCPDGIVFRQLDGGRDWDASMELAQQTAVEEGYDPIVHTPFLQRRNATRRTQIAAGLGAWFGAFDGNNLVGQMGMFHYTDVARFQSVETRATHRRRGICAALLGHVSSWAACRAPAAVQVIIAQADSDAGRLYRHAGFTLTETLVEASKNGY